MRHPENMHQLMKTIEGHKRLEDDRQQSKGKASTTSQFNSDPCFKGFQQSKRESRAVEPKVQTRGVNVAFKEPVHKILERIKNKPYFWWLRKMGGY